jgi:hypothetical protein
MTDAVATARFSLTFSETAFLFPKNSRQMTGFILVNNITVSASLVGMTFS